MAKEQKTFIAGRMNKSIDERLLPDGEYVDGQNIRLGSTELADIGAVENTKGNVALTTLKYRTNPAKSQGGRLLWTTLLRRQCTGLYTTQ